MNVYAITTNDNKAGQNDCEVVFRPGAKRVSQAYGGGYATFSNALEYPKNRNDLLAKIKLMPGSLDMFAYFGHGYNNQLGGHILTPADIKLLGDALKPKMSSGGSIVFYSCLAGSANGLTTSLLNTIGNDVWIYGHTSTDHSFKNPDVSEVHNGDGLRFRLLPALYGPQLKTAWRQALEKTDLWLRFPMMHHADIIKELNAARLVGTWSVPGSKKYVFEWPITNGKYTDADSLCVNPHGRVKEAATSRIGEWELDDELVITWGGSDTEEWAMPINPDGQTIRGASGAAKRIAPGKYGSSQG